jgi:N4-gp56 family major capsid protein
METTQGKIFAGAGAAGIDVYSTLIFGQEAYGVSRIAGEAMETIITEPGGNSDPLRQRWTMGWKASFVVKILNDNFIVRLEHARV